MVRALEQTNMSCHDVQAQVIAHGLSNEAAIVFFDALPTIDVLMPHDSNRGNPAQLVFPKDRDRFACASSSTQAACASCALPAAALLRRLQPASGDVEDE
jgi:hypothetical protein